MDLFVFIPLVLGVCAAVLFLLFMLPDIISDLELYIDRKRRHGKHERRT